MLSAVCCLLPRCQCHILDSNNVLAPAAWHRQFGTKARLFLDYTSGMLVLDKTWIFQETLKLAREPWRQVAVPRRYGNM